MSLITVQELQDEAILRDVDITAYSDAMIERKIASAQAYIETFTGRNFDTTTITGEQHLQNKGEAIILDNSPVISVEKILIDGDEYDLTDITIGYETGIIYLQTPTSNIPLLTSNTPFNFNLPYDAVVDYTTGEDATGKTFLIISEICMDLFFAKLNQSSDGQEITSFADSDFKVQYSSKSAIKDIDSRLERFKRPYIAMI